MILMAEAASPDCRRSRRATRARKMTSATSGLELMTRRKASGPMTRTRPGRETRAVR